MLYTKQQNIEISKKRYQNAEQIIKLLPSETYFQECSFEEDKLGGSDFLIIQKILNLKYACRLLSDKPYWDRITFRVHSYDHSDIPNQKYSEYFKIQRNEITWDRYFFGYINTSNIITKWLIFDKKKVVNSGIFDIPPQLNCWNHPRNLKWNDPKKEQDRTGFISCRMSDFFKVNAVLYSYDKKGILDAKKFI